MACRLTEYTNANVTMALTADKNLDKIHAQIPSIFTVMLFACDHLRMSLKYQTLVVGGRAVGCKYNPEKF